MFWLVLYKFRLFGFEKSELSLQKVSTRQSFWKRSAISKGITQV